MGLHSAYVDSSKTMFYLSKVVKDDLSCSIDFARLNKRNKTGPARHVVTITLTESELISIVSVGHS